MGKALYACPREFKVTGFILQSFRITALTRTRKSWTTVFLPKQQTASQKDVTDIAARTAG